MIRRNILTAVLALSASTSAVAGNAETAREVATKTIDEIFAVLRATVGNTTKLRAERVIKLRAVVDTVFDWEQMAKRSLGVHWRGASQSQRARYLSVFKDLLANQHIDDMDKFRGTEVVEIHGEKDTGRYTVVESTLTTHSREKVPLHYTMIRVGDRWWVHDISIEGVSMVNHYRKSFNRFLTNRDIESLLKRLESKRR